MMLETFGDEYAAYMARTKLSYPESGDVPANSRPEPPPVRGTSLRPRLTTESTPH